jgi:acetyl-CoA synthetase
MSETLFKVPRSWSASAHVDDAKYREMYAKSVSDPESFWGEHGKRIDWIEPQGDRPDRLAGHHSVCAGTAEDPFGKNHASDPA